jgi:dTDP-4-dehydrorhamnose 3,5-epimerase-like enzyme
MGQDQIDQNQFMLLIPQNVYHIYNVVGKDHALLLNFPTKMYNPDDEGRFDFDKVIIDSLGKPFTWDLLKKGLA